MPLPETTPLTLPERRLLTDEVFEKLSCAIVRGELSPGEKIHDLDLAARLGLSRATVRTALLRLADVGLVDFAPNLYTRVATLDLDRYLQTQDTGRALYVYAARRGTARFTDEQIARLQQWAAHLGNREHVDREAIFSGAASAGFFHVFIEAMQNRALDRTIQRISPHLRRMMGRYAELMPVDVVDEAALACVEAAARRDGPATAEAMIGYYEGPLEVFHSRLRELPEFS